MTVVYEIKKTLSDAKKKEVIELLIAAFPGIRADLELSFSEFLKSLVDVDHILILGSRGDIVGYQLLIPKEMTFQAIKYSVCGMSYMAISPEYQNSEISILLKKITLQKIKDFDLSFGCARKAMDNYWRPFGFIGVTNFNILTLNFKKIPMHGSPYIKFRNMESADMDMVKSINRLSRSDQWFEFFRTEQDWNLWKTKALDVKFTSLLILMGGEVIGYIIIFLDVVIEFELKKDFEKHALKIIKNFCSENNIALIRLEISLNSSIMTELRKVSHEVNCRYVYEGGHFIKANNLGLLLMKSTPIFEKRLLSSGIGDVSFDFDNFKFRMQEGKLKVFEDGSGKIRDEWKLLMLMGVDGMLNNYFYNDLSFPILRIIFPVMHPQFKYLDQI